MDTGHFGSKTEDLRHRMMTVQKPHLNMDTGYFGSKSKELHHTMHIHTPHLDMDTGQFGSKSKELRYHMIFVVPTWIWIQVILDPSQKNYVIR